MNKEMTNKIQNFRKIRRNIKNIQNKVEFSNETIFTSLEAKNQRVARYLDSLRN